MFNIQKSATISDIASYVGVSKTTVSHYLNGKYENMSVETKERIKDAIEKLNYSPNNAARVLKSRKSNLIGVVIHNFANQVLTLLVRGICDACFENGYSPIIFNSYEDAEIEKKNLQACIDNQVEGIILSPSSENAEYYNSIEDTTGIPVIMINRVCKGWVHDAVYIDHYALVTKALNHVWQNGYKRIVMVESDFSSVSTKRMRKEAFEDFMISKFPDSTTDIIHVKESKDNSSLLSGEIRYYLQMYSNDNISIFAIDNIMLYKTIEALREMYDRIPDRLALIGYDAWDWAALITPSITTVTQPFWELGAFGAKMLIKRLSGGYSDNPQVVKLDGKLMIRESTLPPSN